MVFRRVKNDTGSRCKRPALRRRGDMIELVIDVHDVDRIGLQSDDRVVIDVDEQACMLAVAKAGEDDCHSWKFVQNKGGDIKVVMGHRALGLDVEGVMPAVHVELSEQTLLLKFDPAAKADPGSVMAMELMPLA